ncbi:hypothetical protein PQX77_003209, partial [Marasmius sp. AFHP31]
LVRFCTLCVHFGTGTTTATSLPDPPPVMKWINTLVLQWIDTQKTQIDIPIHSLKLYNRPKVPSPRKPPHVPQYFDLPSPPRAQAASKLYFLPIGH